MMEKKPDFFFQVIHNFAKVGCDRLKNEAIVVYDLIIDAFLA